MKAFMQWLTDGIFTADPKVKQVKSSSATRCCQSAAAISLEEKEVKQAEELLKTFWLRGWR